MKAPLLTRLSLAALLLRTPVHTHAAPSSNASGPVVKLDYGSFEGVESGNITKFLGMPFAAPPVGKLRFAPPTPPVAFSGIHKAGNYGVACPQQAAILTVPPSLNIPENATSHLSSPPIPTSEDCLFVNVIKPASTKDDSKKLPVVFWIYGGTRGFEFGDTSFYPGDTVVNQSLALDEPIIYVSANYRTNAFGFLGGKEAQENGAGNVGLKDQRFAMQWIQKYIHNFGGDPERVTIWGESAGAISAALHLVINDGNAEGLFRAAVMESGSTTTLNSITEKQPVYDQLVSDTGCKGSQDTFACLRDVPFDSLMTAVNNTPSIYSYQSLQNTFEPTIDGTFISRGPMTSVQKGLYAKVPIIHGDTDDEATVFSLSSLNVTTDAEFRDYVSTLCLPGVTDDQLDAIMSAYPSDITKGSPFDTGSDNAATPEFKRIAAFLGDLQFQGPRRFLMQAAAQTQPTFGFLFKRDKDTPFLGSFHSTDIVEFYGLDPDAIALGLDALINFVNTMDPNSPKRNNSLLSSTPWPLYNSSSKAPPMFTFFDPSPSVNITTDDFRASEIQLLNNISMQLYPA
ncbi:Alpha/Beta hydrolase protein [Cyathus striatus]|nr:Alpha/Beta hydrolase protein [Cyathus striatus]